MKNAVISMRGFVIWKIFRIANGYLSVVEVRGVYGLPSGTLESDLSHLLRAKDAASLGEAFRFASAGGGAGDF